MAWAGAVLADVVGERVERGENLAAEVLVVDAHAVVLLEHDDQLEHVDGIQAEPSPTSGAPGRCLPASRRSGDGLNELDAKLREQWVHLSLPRRVGATAAARRLARWSRRTGRSSLLMRNVWDSAP